MDTPYPKLYFITTTCRTFTHHKIVYKDVDIRWYMERDTPLTLDYASLIRDYQPDVSGYVEAMLQECFTPDEARHFLTYLQDPSSDDTHTQELVVFPRDTNEASLSALGEGGPLRLIRLTSDDTGLPFNIVGYFDLSECPYHAYTPKQIHLLDENVSCEFSRGMCDFGQHERCDRCSTWIQDDAHIFVIPHVDFDVVCTACYEKHTSEKTEEKGDWGEEIPF